MDFCFAWGCTLYPGVQLQHTFPCKFSPTIFLRPGRGGARAPSAPPGYAYVYGRIRRRVQLVAKASRLASARVNAFTSPTLNRSFTDHASKELQLISRRSKIRWLLPLTAVC